jgi:CheY-like chemotaxis protein
MIRRAAEGRSVALPKLEGVQVLLVEDDIDNRNVLATALKHCGATVQCATSGRAAFAIVSNWKPDVIVSDIALADMDGCDFLSRIRTGENGVTSSAPALALTVLSRPGEQERVLAAGFAMFRQKPIDPIDLAHETARLARRE